MPTPRRLQSFGPALITRTDNCSTRSVLQKAARARVSAHVATAAKAAAIKVCPQLDNLARRSLADYGLLFTALPARSGVRMIADNVPRFTTPGSFTALVVEPHLPDALFVISTLSGLGSRVTAADFREAKARLSFSPPDLLVVDVRQGDYNGLHLVLRGKAIRPQMAALVTSGYEDVVLRREAESLLATFVVKPLPNRELIAAVARTMWRGGGPPEPIRQPFERRNQERRVANSGIEMDRRQSERRRHMFLATS